MTFSYLITLIVVLSIATDGSSRYKNKVQLLPLMIQSKPSFIYFLFIKHLKRDIYGIILSSLIIILSNNSINLKISLFLLWVIVQALVRTYDYLLLKNTIWLICAPLILSSLLLDESLTLTISLFTYFILIVSINNVLNFPLKLSDETKVISLKSLSIVVLTLLSCFIFEISTLSSNLNLSQIVPIVILIVTLKLETMVTSKKEVIQRFQSYVSIFKVRISKLSVNILGPQVRLSLKSSLSLVLTLIIVFCFVSKRIDTTAVLLLLTLYVILANVDLLIYYFILDKSIVYENSVTRFLVTQIPGTFIFTYITIVSIDMYIPENHNPLPLSTVNFGLIMTLLILIILYLHRLRIALRHRYWHI